MAQQRTARVEPRWARRRLNSCVAAPVGPASELDTLRRHAVRLCIDAVLHALPSTPAQVLWPVRPRRLPERLLARVYDAAVPQRHFLHPRPGTGGRRLGQALCAWVAKAVAVESQLLQKGPGSCAAWLGQPRSSSHQAPGYLRPSCVSFTASTVPNLNSAGYD